MKYIIQAVLAVAAIYFFLFHESLTGKKTEQQQTKQGAVSLQFKDNSLGKRLTELHNAPDFTVPGIFPELSSGVDQLKPIVDKHSTALRIARELEQYNEMGTMPPEMNTDTLLPHVSTLSLASNLLAAAGKVAAADKKTAEAVKDFSIAAKISKASLCGSYFWIEALSAARQIKKLRDAISSSALSAADKKKCLDLLAKRQDCNLALLLKGGREILSHSLANMTAEKFKSDWEYSDEEYDFLKKLSPEQLGALFEKGEKQITPLFLNGTLTKDTPIKIGTDMENRIAPKLLNLTGTARMSAHLAQ